MNDEIREILDNKLYFDLEEEDYIKIKDYITNLQKENERLNNVINELEKVFIDCDYQHLQRKLKKLKGEKNEKD